MVLGRPKRGIREKRSDISGDVPQPRVLGPDVPAIEVLRDADEPVALVFHSLGEPHETSDADSWNAQRALRVQEAFPFAHRPERCWVEFRRAVHDELLREGIVNVLLLVFRKVPEAMSCQAVAEPSAEFTTAEMI